MARANIESSAGKVQNSDWDGLSSGAMEVYLLGHFECFLVWNVLVRNDQRPLTKR